MTSPSCVAENIVTIATSLFPCANALQQIASHSGRRQELYLCLRSERQPPQLDEAKRGVMIELIATIIRCQAVVIERMLRFTPDNAAIPIRYLHTHSSAGETLRTLHICRQA